MGSIYCAFSTIYNFNKLNHFISFCSRASRAVVEHCYLVHLLHAEIHCIILAVVGKLTLCHQALTLGNIRSNSAEYTGK